jgi:multisubunit Na+/H+ antiporter MnhG subunit
VIDVLVVALLGIGVVVSLLCAVGLLLARDELDGLHFVALAGTLGVGPIVAALVLAAPISTTAFKSILVLLLTGVGGPVLAHTTGRAIRLRRQAKEEEP